MCDFLFICRLRLLCAIACLFVFVLCISWCLCCGVCLCLLWCAVDVCVTLRFVLFNVLYHYNVSCCVSRFGLIILGCMCLLFLRVLKVGSVAL